MINYYDVPDDMDKGQGVSLPMVMGIILPEAEIDIGIDKKVCDLLFIEVKT